MKSKKELLNDLESKRKLIEYYKKQNEDLNVKIKSLEDYIRGMKDIAYYIGRKG